MPILRNWSSSVTLQVIKWIWNTVFHQILAVVTVYAVWPAIDHYRGIFSWHVILSTFGVFFIGSESLIVFSGSNVWSADIAKDGKKWLHGIMTFIGISMVLSGITLEIIRSDKDLVAHFSTAHGVMGLLTLIFIFLLIVSGFLSGFSFALKERIAPVWLKILHNVLGQLGYVIGVVCMILGFYTGWFTIYSTESSRIVATVAAIVATLWSLLTSWRSICRYGKSIRSYMY